MDFNSSETTLLQARRIFLILSSNCKEIPTEEFWVLHSIQMIAIADVNGIFYLVRLNLIDFNQKLVKINIDRFGDYKFIKDLNS